MDSTPIRMAKATVRERADPQMALLGGMSEFLGRKRTV